MVDPAVFNKLGKASPVSHVYIYNADKVSFKGQCMVHVQNMVKVVCTMFCILKRTCISSSDTD